ncbi:unnamed protein product [Closterium sp. NIES-53]
MAANRGWRIKQMDITTAFLNGIILEELYMLQPEGLDDGSGRVCRLKKAIYGLKQARRAWYHKLEETLLAGGFKKSECDHSLFLLQEKEQFLMLLVYVDDILLFSKSSAMIEHVEEMLEMQFKCSKMGDVKYYLGMHVERDLDKGVLRLHQRKYCEGLAEKYGLQDGGKPATPLPSGFTVEPCADEEVVGESDRKLFHSMRLQRGAADLGKGEMLLTCYTDASFNSVKADGTSIGGYVCLFGGGSVSWRSKKQNEVGQSSCEIEYMALHHGAKEVVWLRRLLKEIGVCQKERTVIFCDNESAVKLAKNACLHGLTKHIRPKWHWVRKLLDKEVRLEIVKTHQQAADILTKRLAESEHWKGMKLAGMSSFTLPDSSQQNGISERRIGLVMEVARTSMINAATSHFLWPFAVRYDAHHLKLWPRISLPETSPTLRWTGEVGDASVFRVWGSRAFVRDTSADKLSARAIPCVFLGFVPDAPGWQFYHPTSRRVLPSQDVTFDKSVPFYRLFPYRSAPPPPQPLFLAPGPPPVDPLPPQGLAPSSVSQVDPLPGTAPVEVAVSSSAARGAASRGVERGGAGSEGAGSWGCGVKGR